MERRLIHKKGIRSTIWAAIAAVMATIVLVVASSANNSALAASSLVNGIFETGDRGDLLCSLMAKVEQGEVRRLL